MPTTTNYGWTTPADTDLVKDGAGAIRTLGTSVDTTVKALNPGTTSGDLDYYTAATTKARIAKGTAGQVFTMNSGATAPEWATPTGAPTSYGLSAGKNIVINGGFDIWQRGTSGTANSSSAGAGYNADRWQNRFETGALTVSRQATSDTTNLPNIQYCARVQRNSGNTVTNPIYHVQTIETSNTIPRVGQTVILSFYARKGANFSATSNTLSAILDGGTGTDQNIFGFTGYAGLINSAVTLTATWQRFTASVTVTSTLTELGVGFSYTPVGTAGANDYFEVTGVQLELGTSATAFSRNGTSIQGELAACQRYFQQYTIDVAYGTLSNYGSATSTTSAESVIPLKTTMRIKPATLTYGNLAWNNGVAVVAITSAALAAESSTQFAYVTGTVASGLTQYRPYALSGNNNAAAYIGISAEL